LAVAKRRIREMVFLPPHLMMLRSYRTDDDKKALLCALRDHRGGLTMPHKIEATGFELEFCTALPKSRPRAGRQVPCGTTLITNNFHRHPPTSRALTALSHSPAFFVSFVFFVANLNVVTRISSFT
jgi:hypothetical protein